MAPEVDAAAVVAREPVPVLFLRTSDEVAEIRAGWERIEHLVGLRGRRFYGALDLRAKEYRVCVAPHEGDDAVALGLEVGELPGGRYLRARLHGEPPEVYDRIGPTFDALSERMPIDESRPSIEHYRRRDEIDLLLPVE